MANYWYWSWHRQFKTGVLPALKKIYELYAQQVVPALELGRQEGAGQAESSDPDAALHPYADSAAMIRGLREEATTEQSGLTQALAVYTRATCEALYLEATRFLVRLYRREMVLVGEGDRAPLSVVGEPPSVFLEKGLNLRPVAGFKAYQLLRLVAHYHGYVPGDSGEELRRTRPEWVHRSALGSGIVLVTPPDVKHLYEDLCRFLERVVEALHQITAQTTKEHAFATRRVS